MDYDALKSTTTDGRVNASAANEPDKGEGPRTPEAIVFESPSKVQNSTPKLNVNEKLKENLEKHGIAKRDAGSFLIGLLKDKEFKNLVRASIDNENDDPSDDDQSNFPMTRSKLKEVMQNSPFKSPWPETERSTKARPTKFTEIPLPENDDEDEEYKPMESSFGSDTQDLPYTDERTSDPTAISLNVSFEASERLVLDIPDDFEVIGPPNALSNSMTPSRNPDDIISKRTRSKHSLQSTSLNVLEAAFDPPDISEDAYEPTSVVDDDWQEWLANLIQDTGGNGNATEDEDDPVADPDFNFIPELDRPDEEDLKDDFTVRVSKKELHGLLDEIESMENNDWPLVTYITTEPSLPRKKKQKGQKSKSDKSHPTTSSAENEIPLLHMSLAQSETVTQQLQQHVQLLVQTNLLCRNNSELEEIIAESRDLLVELADIGQKQVERLGIHRSTVTPWTLKDAQKACDKEIPPSEPCIRLLRTEKVRRHIPLPKGIVEIMGNSKVFMYKELLPISAPASRDHPQKMAFLHSEDCLLTLGLAEMGELPNYFNLISKHMLPTRTDKQIAARYRNVTYCRNYKDAVNPIYRYHNHGTLPRPNTSVKFLSRNDARKPVDMKGDVPCWVLSLHPIAAPEESSDDSTSNLGHLFSQSGHCKPHPPGVFNNQHTVVSPIKGIMVPYSIPCTSASLSSTPISQIPMFQNSTVGIQITSSKHSVCVVSTRLAMRTQPHDSSITSTSNTVKTLPTAQVQNHTQYGQRKSAGKSIRRLSESQRIEAGSLSSSSSEDEVAEITSIGQMDAQSEDDIHPVESGEDENSDHEISVDPSHTAGKAPQMESVHEIDDPSIIPKGGFMHKTHPRLVGKKTKSGSRDMRRLRSTAKVVRSLEEETIVQLDPKRSEKEKIFASGYLERVENTLKSHPDIFKKFLDTLAKYSDGTKTPIDLYTEVSDLLRNWPDLVQGLAPFLMPEQARECGLDAEQEVYARARKFLRQLEIRFGDNPEHMEKILNVFHNVAETAIYREEEMMKSILSLLKDCPYLQDEFLTFFDDQRPPKAMFDEDFEEVDFTEEMIKDPTLNQFEHATLLATVNEPPEQSRLHENNKRPRKRRISVGSNDGSKSPVKVSNQEEDNKENAFPEPMNLDEEDDVANTDYESEDGIEDGKNESEENQHTSAPPDIAVISEDALSSSPFKRITGEAQRLQVPLRPDTPTGFKSENTHSTTLSTSPPQPKRTRNEAFPVIPLTPGKDLGRNSGEDLERDTEKVENFELKDSAVDVPASHQESVEPIAQENTSPEKAVCKKSAEKEENEGKIKNTLSPPRIVQESVVSQTLNVNKDPDDKNLEESAPPMKYPVPPSLEKSPPPQNEDPHTSIADAEPVWDREADELILTSCRQGLTSEMFSGVAEKLKCTPAHVESRLSYLFQLFNGTENEDGQSQESEEDSEIFSDSSAI